MPRIMITCPNTERPIYTHQTSDWSQFDELTLQDETVECPECGASHAWSKGDAYLEEEGGGD